MVRFPNAKINLGLNIVDKRNDGYHNLETVFCPVSFSDVLEIIPGKKENSFHCSGLPIKGRDSENLCMKALNLLKDEYDLPPLQIFLHKIIPMGAGFGGGSSDGACMLQMLNDHFQLGINEKQLSDKALLLGSDCPFFIFNKPAFANGRGEELTPVNILLKGYTIVLAVPEVHVSTREAFSNVFPEKPVQSLIEIIEKPVEEWKDNMRNDFEKSVFIIHPVVKTIKEKLYDAGAVYASMTGTGSGVYGIFGERNPKINLPPKTFSWLGAFI